VLIGNTAKGQKLEKTLCVILENNMNTAKGTQLVNDFIQELKSQCGITISRTSISRNIFELSGKYNCLLYVKGRSEQPYRWGVTANVIERLQAQPKKWMVILLFDSHKKGYFLNSDDIKHYIKNVWPLGADGDYKPASGSYLSRNTALHSMKDFLKGIEINSAA